MNETTVKSKSATTSYAVISIVFFLVFLIVAAIHGDNVQAREGHRLLELSNNIALWSVAVSTGYCLYALAGKAGKVIGFLSLAFYVLGVLLLNSFTFENPLFTKQLIYTALMGVAFTLAEKSFSKDKASLPPVIIISLYAGVSVLLVYGFTGGHLMAALICAASVFLMIFLLRAAVEDTSALLQSKRIIFTIIGAAIAIGMIIYAISAFKTRNFSDDEHIRLDVKREFAKWTAYILLGANAVGYILVLCRAKCGAALSLLSAWMLVLMLLFTALSNSVFTFDGLNPFASRLLCGVPSAVYSTAVLIPIKKKPEVKAEVPTL